MPHHYFQSLPDDEQEFIREVALSIEERLRAQEELDHLDRVLARRVGVELHIVSRATDYIRSEDLIREVGTVERDQALLDEVRRRDRSIVEMLKGLGVLEIDDVDIWRELLEGE